MLQLNTDRDGENSTLFLAFFFLFCVQNICTSISEKVLVQMIADSFLFAPSSSALHGVLTVVDFFVIRLHGNHSEVIMLHLSMRGKSDECLHTR